MAEIYSFTILAVKNLKWSCWQGRVLSEGSRRNSSFPLLGVLWLVATSLHSLPPSLHTLLYWDSSVCSNFSLLIRASSVDRRPTPIQYDLILSWLSSKMLFPNEVSFTGIRGENFNISFGGIRFNTQYPGKGQKHCEDHTPKTQTHDALQRLRLNPKIREFPFLPWLQQANKSSLK